MWNLSERKKSWTEGNKMCQEYKVVPKDDGFVFIGPLQSGSNYKSLLIMLKLSEFVS